MSNSAIEQNFDSYATKLARDSKMIHQEEFLEDCSFSIDHLGCGCNSCRDNLPVISLTGRNSQGKHISMYCNKHDLDVLLLGAMTFTTEEELRPNAVTFYDEEQAKNLLT